MNRLTNNLVYYLNANKMAFIEDGLWGMRIVARPTSGFRRYAAAEFRSEGYWGAEHRDAESDDVRRCHVAPHS